MDYVTVGVIVNTHGLKGTLKVKSYTDFKDIRYQQGATLYIAFRGTLVPVTVSEHREVKGLDYLDFKEFTDINQCEIYKGFDLVIPKSAMHELQDDEFYFDELIGMNVKGTTMKGIVTDVREVPQGQLLVVDVDGKDVLIPFRKEFIESVDKQKGEITIIQWEGLS